MDGALNNRRRSEHNINYIQSAGKRNNTENADYVGITISDDFSQKQLPPLPVINNSPHSQQQQQQNGLRYNFFNTYHTQRPLQQQQSNQQQILQQQSHNQQPILVQQSNLQQQILMQNQPSTNQLPQSIKTSYQQTYLNSPSNSSPNKPSTTSYSSNNNNKSSYQLHSSTHNDYASKADFRDSLFLRVRSKSDLQSQPAFREISTVKSIVNPLKSLTVNLTTTYQNINPNFRYELSYNPRRVLTKPSKGVKNDGYDNEDSDYILYVNDILGSEEGQKYLILDILGQGTFGQVVKCQNLKTKEIVAVKVVKNKPAYFNQSMMEVTILELLNQTWDIKDQHHILRLLDTFIHHRHLCLVFELLSVNLYELIKQNQFRGLSTNLVRLFTAQLLDALTVLNEARIIHCDLKPENVLLKNLESPTIKVIDFGSACHERQTVYTYIQSRFYRSPEVLLDMWSLGCIAAELFLGLPLFPGSSEYNQVSRIVEMLGVPPPYMIEVGKTAHGYFERHINEHGQKKYRLKSMEQYMQEHGCVEQVSKRYFSATTLPEIIKSYPILRKGLSQKDVEKEMQNRLAFIDFVQGLLNLNPIERWSPQQAKLHPFITGEKLTGKFTPPMQLKSPNKVCASSTQSPNSQSTTNTHLTSLSTNSQYKTSNCSPTKVLNKNPVIITHDIPTVTISSNSIATPISSAQILSTQQSSNISTLTPKSGLGSLRPRASTIGNIQVPPQIQRAAALVSPGNTGTMPIEKLRPPKEKDPRHITQLSVVVDGEDRRAY
nr:7095_t:CDS:2 [Entrophospora candida]